MSIDPPAAPPARQTFTAEVESAIAAVRADVATLHGELAALLLDVFVAIRLIKFLFHGP